MVFDNYKGNKNLIWMGDILHPLWSTSTIRGEGIKQQKRIILIPTNGIMKMKQIFSTNVLIQGK